MKKICFLTCKDLDGYVVDDELVIRELEKNQDYQITSVPWDADYDWKKFDLVIIRTTWDYVQRINEFLAKLKVIAQEVPLLNALDVVKWNYHKFYLKELAAKGVKIVPTHTFTFPGPITPPVSWTQDRFIIKPAVSATAYKTMIVAREELNSPKILQELYAGDWLLQPFLTEIEKGEISLCYFNKTYSHSIIKIPKTGDFRVQEEHGGDIQSYVPDEELIGMGKKIVDAIAFDLLYGRVDLVKSGGEYFLMELELIEPSLYFRTNSQSVINFKAALDKIFTSP